MVELVSARTPLCARSAARYTGRCPFHEERTPSFSVNAADKLYYCFGCGEGGDAITFVRETEELDFAEAIEWLAERFRVHARVRGDLARGRARSAARRERLHALLEQAARSTSATSGRRRRASPCASTWPARGLGEEVCKEFRLGLSPGGTRLVPRRRARRASRPTSCVAAGLANRRGNDYFQRPARCSRSPTRAGACSASRRASSATTTRSQAKYVNSPESELFHKGDILYGLDLARRGDREAGPGGRRRGEHRRARAAAGGLEPVVASMGTALTERQLQRARAA